MQENYFVKQTSAHPATSKATTVLTIAPNGMMMNKSQDPACIVKRTLSKSMRN
jgi:hypothetical protein